MLSESNSESDLVLQNHKLPEEIERLKPEKIDLEILLETTMLHADLVEQELYHSHHQLQEEINQHQVTEQQLRTSEKKLQSLLERLSQTNTDLEIML
ncbi:MAG: diguanylate cyclase [Limnospira sp. PMC 737.11]|uniref:diguanylate cyclase n=1 Tax=Limnospira sp. PMC 737.11 TaxID=2981095 RepID=UPI0028E0B1BA|nr:diguanylate cyclase [Limnospira sp. PMC 737.11]MDT9273327.1 diguanylate cyclase [Limnospira sp. PMC 737.11]